jgi:oxygen-dependent protoporphyrinogen oxidase
MNEALKDIELSLGITDQPVSYEVTKWMNSMPYYHIKHRQIVEALEQKLAALYPRVLLAGCSYYGVGIPDCIANGEQIAEAIVEQIEAGMRA